MGPIWHEELVRSDASSLGREVVFEVKRAMGMFPSIHSPHEGLGVIREEYIEFEAEVFKFNLTKGRDTRPEMRKELIQLAAMAIRTILDCDLTK